LNGLLRIRQGRNNRALPWKGGMAKSTRRRI
jgi:hypothetical protein